MNNVSQQPTALREDKRFMSEARLFIAPIDSKETFKDKAYAALRNVIVSSDVYHSRTGVRLMPKSKASRRSSSRISARLR